MLLENAQRRKNDLERRLQVRVRASCGLRVCSVSDSASIGSTDNLHVLYEYSTIDLIDVRGIGGAPRAPRAATARPAIYASDAAADRVQEVSRYAAHSSILVYWFKCLRPLRVDSVGQSK